MFEPEKIARRNLLQYAESIGGKQMYLRMNKAVRDAHLQSEETLNKKQIDAVLGKLVEQEDVHLDKMKFRQLLGERERRRQVYIKMAAESEDDELYGGMSSEVGGIGGGIGGKQRYDYRKMPAGPKGVTHSAGSVPVSSVARLQRKPTPGKPGPGQKNIGPKTSASNSGPVSSIAHIMR